jgi:excisionase family DNA binding protein
MTGPVITAEELAERWQVTTGWVYSKVRSGELPKIPLPGKYVRFRLDEIESYERGESPTQKSQV